MPRGGSRPGSGRPPGPPTVRVRVPELYAKDLPDILKLYDLAKEWRSKPELCQSPPSPRWAKLSQFFKACEDAGIKLFDF